MLAGSRNYRRECAAEVLAGRRKWKKHVEEMDKNQTIFNINYLIAQNKPKKPTPEEVRKFATNSD